MQDVILHRQRFFVQHCLGDLLRLGQIVVPPVRRGDAQLGVQAAARLGQAFQQQRVERPALAVQNHLHRGVVVEGLLVAALARQRVVDVGHCDDLRGDGDVLALQPVGVAAAVPPLVMPTADGVGCPDKLGFLLERQLVQYVRTDGGVGLHDLEFILRQPTGLIQDGFGNVDLADVVQRRRRADKGNVRRAEVVLVGFLHQRVQQNVGGRLDVQHMHATLAVAELDDMAQNVDHRRVAFLFLVNLLRHKADEVLLLGVEHQRIDDAAAHDGHIERAADVVCRTEVIRAFDIAGCVLGRDHDDRDLVDPVIFVHHSQHVEAVHLRHHDVQQQKIDVRAGLQNADSLAAILGLQNFVTVAQHFGQDGAVHRRVVGDQDFSFLVHGSPFCLVGKGTAQKRILPNRFIIV